MVLEAHNPLQCLELARVVKPDLVRMQMQWTLARRPVQLTGHL